MKTKLIRPNCGQPMGFGRKGRASLHVLLVALLVGVAAPAMAKVTFPVTVPTECVELAQREGVPVLINSRYEATKAKLKLARLSGRDPMVQECRAAVERARRAALQN